jgi:hypothetical protein
VNLPRLKGGCLDNFGQTLDTSGSIAEAATQTVMGLGHRRPVQRKQAHQRPARHRPRRRPLWAVSGAGRAGRQRLTETATPVVDIALDQQDAIYGVCYCCNYTHKECADLAVHLQLFS